MHVLETLNKPKGMDLDLDQLGQSNSAFSNWTDSPFRDRKLPNSHPSPRTLTLNELFDTPGDFALTFEN